MTDEHSTGDPPERWEGGATAPPDQVRRPDEEGWGVHDGGSRGRVDGRVRAGGDGRPPEPPDGRGDDPPWPERPEGWRHDAPDPPDAFPVPWSWTDGLFLVAWFLVASVIVATVAFALGVDPFNDAAMLFGVVAASHATALVGVFVWLSLRDGLSWRLMGPLRPRWVRHSLVGVGIGLSGWVIVTLLLALLVRAIDREALPTQEGLEQLAGADGTAVLVAVFAAVVLAPVVEEVIYRGVLFQALRERIGLWPAMVISAGLFGVMHLDTVMQAEGFDPVGFIPMMGIVLLGVWLAAAFHKTGSIIVPIVGHAAFNGIAVGLALLSMGRDDLEVPTAVLGPLVRVLSGG